MPKEYMARNAKICASILEAARIQTTVKQRQEASASATATREVDPVRRSTVWLLSNPQESMSSILALVDLRLKTVVPAIDRLDNDIYALETMQISVKSFSFSVGGSG